MTLMEQQVQPFKPRLVLWPRGAVLFSTNLHGLGAGNVPSDSVLLALRFVIYHFHHQRNRLVTYGDWLRIAALKINLSRECAFLLFAEAQTISPVHRERRIASNTSDSDLESRADVLGLVVALALLGCAPDENGNRNVAKYIKDNLNVFLSCLLLCNYALASENITSSRLEQIPRLDLIPATALSNLDVLFEGTLRTEKQMSTVGVIPTSISALLMAVMHWELKDQIPMQDLLEIFRKTLQTDMFSLDDIATTISTAKSEESTSRTMTSTQLAEHRKITVRRWSHIELLTKHAYRGANLRIKGPHKDGSVLICPRAMRSALIKDIRSSGPIILGPINGLLILDGLENLHVSAICERIIIQNCKEITVFLNTRTSPAIGRNCQQIRLAPYNTYFDGLFQELQYSGLMLLSGNENRWDQPIQVDSIQLKPGPPPLRVWSFLPLDAFYIQPTPFPTNKGSTLHDYFLRSIPAMYLDSFEERMRSAELWLQRNPENRLIGVPEKDREYLKHRVSLSQ
ncbi:unnamed protein product [Bursaphelenchus xylophilus]|uniref:(pine wood nematode) hypothetical protein n=1 Tax=Bursaphelenchus xylophilus TaxID=6326 RepID=A0A1I7S704_BURXY|nr:unnamed protein product [Bursaphelenchus xylophilus]CAG9079489.1 unnamed protein product [Bursaphelenchus xylophilus]